MVLPAQIWLLNYPLMILRSHWSSSQFQPLLTTSFWNSGKTAQELILLRSYLSPSELLFLKRKENRTAPACFAVLVPEDVVGQIQP